MIELPGSVPVVAANVRSAARELDCALIEVGDLSLRIGRVNCGRNCREQFLQSLLAFAQALLRELSRRDIARNFRGTDDASGSIPYRRYGQGNINQVSVLAPPHRFEVIDAFAGPDLRQDFRLFVQAVVGYQQRDWPADDFIPGKSEQPLCTGVPGL